MAETSGFFAAMVDGNTGAYDRKYIAKQFANYFSLFIGNGVFGNPTNQLMVKPGNGLSIIVSEGRAFIDGYWYYNDSDKVIPLVTNYESVARTDSVRLRMSEDTRDIKVDVFTGDTELVRGEDTYDLQLATVQVMPMSETVTAAQIHDTRPDQSVCGFVTGLMKVQTTADLFAQYQEMFEEWFETMKDQLSEDAAGNLQVQIDEINSTLQPFVRKTLAAVNKTVILYTWKYGVVGQTARTVDISDKWPTFSTPQTNFVSPLKMLVPVILIEYTPTGMDKVGRMISGGITTSEDGAATFSCMSTLRRKSFFEVFPGGGNNVEHPASDELKTYVRNVAFSATYETIEISDNRELVLDSTEDFYDYGETYNDGNVVNRILGLCYYGEIVDNIKVF